MATAKSPKKSPTKSPAKSPAKKPASRAAAAKSGARKSAPVRAKAPAKKSAAKSSARRPIARTTTAKKAPARKTKVDRIAPTKTAVHKARKAKRPTRAARKEISHIDRVWELAERIGICMFTTWDGERQRSRPLAAHIDRKAHVIDFLTDIDGHKDEQVAKFPTVSLSFSDGRKNRYVAITGKAELNNDRGLIKKLWNPWAKAWWDSPEDPKIRVIRVTPEDAELWDSPGRVASTVAMLAAALTGKSPKLLDNAKLETI
jgi:general stress protein 26